MKKFLPFLLILFSAINTAQADDNEIDKTPKYSIDIFFTNSQDFFDAYQNAEDLDPIGSFFGNLQNKITLSLNTPYQYFSKGSTGYYFNYNLVSFNFNEQDTTITGSGIREADLGTSIKGYNAYIYGSVFMNFGDKYIINDKGSSFKIGLSIGPGYLKAKGDMILTELPDAPLLKVDINNIGIAYGLFLDYRYGPWVFRLEVVTTEAKQDNYLIGYTTIPMQVGYSLAF